VEPETSQAATRGNELVVVGGPGPLPARQFDAETLIERWKEGRSPNTVRAYGRDLAYFARWRGADAPGPAIWSLLTGTMGQANECLHQYRGAMLDAGLAPATVNRRLSALRSIVQLGRTFGMVTWTLEIGGVKTEAYRDTAGPGLDGVAAVKRQAAKHENPAKAARDVAIVRVLFDLALRRGEIAALDLADLDVRAGRLSVIGKGRREPKRITLPPRTLRALKTWIKHRGKQPGPLFINFHHGNTGLGRLEANGIYWVVRSLGAQVEITARPHGFRHSSITTGLDLFNDPRKVQKHARHSSIDMTMRYDDNRADFGGEVAKVVSEALEE
jgi:integrase/recombinase XerC